MTYNKSMQVFVAVSMACLLYTIIYYVVTSHGYNTHNEFIKKFNLKCKVQLTLQSGNVGDV